MSMPVTWSCSCGCYGCGEEFETECQAKPGMHADLNEQAEEAGWLYDGNGMLCRVCAGRTEQTSRHEDGEPSNWRDIEYGREACS